MQKIQLFLELRPRRLLDHEKKGTALPPKIR